jgi:hypothetical protein
MIHKVDTTWNELSVDIADKDSENNDFRLADNDPLK